MNYQYLLRQIYNLAKSQKEETTIIENPYDLDSRELKSINSSYDLSVLNTSISTPRLLAIASILSKCSCLYPGSITTYLASNFI